MNSTPDTITAALHEPEVISLMGAQMLVVARMGDGDDDTVIIRSTMGAGPRQVPLHAHADVESFLVLAGELQVYVEDARPGWRTIGAGRSLTVPANVRHAVRNVSGAPVDSILATTARIARFFSEIATRPGETFNAPPSAEDITHIRAVADRYDYWMGSPADNAALPA